MAAPPAAGTPIFIASFFFVARPVRATRPVSTLYRSLLPRGTSVVNRMAIYERPFTLPGRRTAVTFP